MRDPEQKRRIIGHTFIEVFEEEARKLRRRRGAEFLVQGTLYPDVIESVSVRGPSATIKTHHNVGGLPERMQLALVEPLRELFKDEVREVGRKLGLPEALVGRHPFPGPGPRDPRDRRGHARAARDRCAAPTRSWSRRSARAGLYDELWQAFAVFLPVQSVGVMGDERTYENAIARALRDLGRRDDRRLGARCPHERAASAIGTRIINEVKGVNRVVYDISSKPPATIEWE